MEEEFHLKVTSDDKTINHRERTHTIEIIKNPSLPKFKVQVPISYDGPKINNFEKFCTPEHYFLAALSGCFSNTFSVIASNSNLDYNDLEIRTKCFIKDASTGKIIDKVKQIIKLTIPSSVSKEKALKVLKATAKVCPIANSIKTKVENKYSILNEE
jgi:organic hydroperoxide reductase OsmC/OhrA